MRIDISRIYFIS